MPNLSPSQPPETQDESTPQSGSTALRELPDAYLFTGDAEEHARLDTQHFAITLMLGGLFPEQVRGMVEASLQSSGNDANPAVLDIGTGSGAWAIAMAKQFPVHMLWDWIWCPLMLAHLKRYSASSFNVIHIRAMLQGVKNSHEIFYHTHRMLRPGGVLLVLEPLPALFDANKDLIQARTPDDEGFTWFHWLSGMINQAIKARNPSYSNIERVLEVLLEMDHGRRTLLIGKLESSCATACFALLHPFDLAFLASGYRLKKWIGFPRELKPR